MGALIAIAQPMQFNRLQPPDDGAGSGQMLPALFVTELEPVADSALRAMPQGVAWTIPAPNDQIAPNRLILGDYLNRLDAAVADTVGQAATKLQGDCRIVCKRSFDGALTVVVATAHAQALVDALAAAAPGVGAFFTLNPWEALEAATPTLSEAIESRAFWPVLKRMIGEGEDMTQPRQIKLCFVPREIGAAARQPDWPTLAREAEQIGFTTQRTPKGGMDLEAVTVLSGDEISRMSGQIALWIERLAVGFDGWEAQNLVNRPMGN